MKYKMRPEASSDPGEWTVDDLSYQLESAGLTGLCHELFWSLP
jgi:hypothetical protein